MAPCTALKLQSEHRRLGNELVKLKKHKRAAEGRAAEQLQSPGRRAPQKRGSQRITQENLPKAESTESCATGITTILAFDPSFPSKSFLAPHPVQCFDNSSQAFAQRTKLQEDRMWDACPSLQGRLRQENWEAEECA